MTDDTRTQSPAAPPADGGTHTFGSPDGTGTLAPAAPDPAPVPNISGYELLEEVGAGGMGRVFRARQLATSRVVAVKLILAGELAGTAARQRFRAEVETTAKLSHPHIVQLYEAGEADGRAFLSCEFVPGGSLAARLDGTPWEAKRAARLLVPLARAVAYAHAAGVIHRDLKPANVLLAADGAPKVADFGIAKRLDADVTTTGSVMGTPSYMPPEQASSAKAAGPAADVYSLGAVLYELLTGRPPFKGADFVETLDLVRTQEPVPPRALSPRVPRDAETVCLKCLQKDPGKRYASADALADDLERFLSGRPIVARPVGRAERAVRWCRRNPAVAGLLTAVLVVFATGAGVASYFAAEAGARASDATDSAARADASADDARRERDNVAAEREKAEELLYAAQIFQAHVAAVEYRTERLNQLVEATRPQPGRPDRRGWEWHYLRRLTRSWDVERKLDFGSPGFASFDPRTEGLTWSFSADGARAFVYGVLTTPDSAATFYRVVRAGLFDTATGRLIREVPELKCPPDVEPWFPHVSPDLRFVASPEMYRRTEPLPPGVAGPPREVRRYRVRLIELETGAVETPLTELDQAPQAWVAAGGNRVVAFVSPLVMWPVGSIGAQAAGSTGAATQTDRARVEVWERGRSGPVRSEIIPGGGATTVTVAEVSPDATTAVITYTEPPAKGQPGGTRVETWDISGKPVRRGRGYTSPGADAYVGPAFSSNGQFVAVSEGLRVVSVLNTQSGARVGRWEMPGGLAGDRIGGWSVSDDGLRIIGSGLQGAVIVADRIGEASGRAVTADVPAGPDDVGAWQTGVVRAPVETTGLSTLQTRHTPDGRRLFTGDTYGTFRAFDLGRLPGYAGVWPERLRLGDEFCAGTAAGRGQWVLYTPATDFREKRSRLLRVGVYNSHELNIVSEFEIAATRAVGGRPSLDGKRVLLDLTDANPATRTDYDQNLTRWSLRATADPTRELAGGPDGGWFSEDGRWVVGAAVVGWSGTVASERDRVRVYRSDDGRLVRDARFDGVVVAGAGATPGGVLFVVTHPPLQQPAVGKKLDPVPVTVHLLDIETGASRGAWTTPVGYSPARSLFEYDHVLVPVLTFAPDGRTFAVSHVADDGSVRAWVLDAATVKPQAEFMAPPPAGGRPPVHAGTFVNDAGPAFGPGGRLIAWSGRDAVVWSAPGAAPVRLSGHTNGYAAAFSADGRRAFTLDQFVGGAEQTVRVWELPAGRELLTIRLSSDRNSQDFSTAGMWLEGERLHVLTPTGVRVFDGTPLKE